jgi:protein-S-isoprenylcysteine O-methyltransferase Ste14
MKATQWEFTNRAMLFGLIFSLGFTLYLLDHQICVAVFANWLGPRLGMGVDFVASLLLGLGAVILATAALVRTWASAYLQADVVYAADVKTASVVADGPYRHVRNPLYFANVLMAVGMGFTMSRTGFLACLVVMVVFNYRLIFREEAELHSSQGEPYDRYLQSVPRLFPSPWPRLPCAGSQARWRNGLKAESWSWGFALAVAGFAITLKPIVLFIVLGASIAFLFVSSAAMQKKSARRTG